MFKNCVFTVNHGTVFVLSAAYFAEIRRCTFVDDDVPGEGVLEFEYSSFFPSVCLM